MVSVWEIEGLGAKGLGESRGSRKEYSWLEEKKTVKIE